jgi:hypothetical protein
MRRNLLCLLGSRWYWGVGGCVYLTVVTGAFLTRSSARAWSAVVAVSFSNVLVWPLTPGWNIQARRVRVGPLWISGIDIGEGVKRGHDRGGQAGSASRRPSTVCAIVDVQPLSGSASAETSG